MRLATLALLGLLATIAAHANDLAPSYVEFYYSFQNPYPGLFYDLQDTLSPTENSPYFHSTSPLGSAAGVYVGGSDPMVGSFVGSSAVNVVNASTYAYYEFEVLGPADQTVNVDVTGTLSSNVSNLTADSGAYASLAIVQPSDPASPDDGYAVSTLLDTMSCAGTLANVAPCGYSSATLSNAVDVNQLISVLTDTAYVVELDSNSFVGSIDGGGASTVDPTITLDTTDPAYSLQFSPGLLATAATPEPSTLALAATGLLSVAGTLRRRLTNDL